MANLDSRHVGDGVERAGCSLERNAEIARPRFLLGPRVGGKQANPSVTIQIALIRNASLLVIIKLLGMYDYCGIGGYNTVDKRYERFWIDNACTSMQSEFGDVDDSGKVWTMRGEMTDPQSGGRMKKRSLITLKDNDHHSMEMFFTSADGKETKGMEIHYERAK